MSELSARLTRFETDYRRRRFELHTDLSDFGWAKE